MEVMNPIHNTDFDFNNSRLLSLQISNTAPSSPKRFGEYYSGTPTSPAPFPHVYSRDFDDATITGGVEDFAFSAGDESETASLTAEDPFVRGIFKHQKPLPRKPTKLLAKNTIFSPWHKKEANLSANSARKMVERGREKGTNSSLSSRRATRSESLPPFRVSQTPFQEEEEEEESKQEKQLQGNTETTSRSIICPSNSFKGSKKWRLKDLFLFRSASEGRAADRDPLKKYTASVLQRHHYAKASSFKTADGPGSVTGSRRRGPVSAHEVHYTVNRAVSEDLKKKTFLPYKQGILGRLAFNPAAHALANGFGLSRK